jgi:signal transduction histidine kinase
MTAALTVRADAGQLRRAMLNLARNAAAVMQGRAGRVVLAAVDDGARVRLEVRDQGPGVPLDLREKIFTPFFTTREKGTAPDGGAVFHIDLPRRA